MSANSPITPMRAVMLLVLLCSLSGCASLVAGAFGGFADNLGGAVRDQTDPETVREGAPAFLLLLDGVVASAPDHPELLSAAANLYAAYATLFAHDDERAQRLSKRARTYGERALCAQNKHACGPDDATFDAYMAMLSRLRPRDAAVLYDYSLSRLAWIRAHRDDWVALGYLPKVEAALERVQTLAPEHEAANVNLYLGVLATLRPAALGGDPEGGRAHFERALELSGGRDLSAKVEYARGYARLMYDRELHDRLLTEVLEADPVAPGLTLTNTLAQTQARMLLASADEHF